MTHWSEAFVVALIAISGVLSLATAIAWRRLSSARPDLPIWQFLRCNEITRDDAGDVLSGRALMQAEYCCAQCPSVRQCRAGFALAAATTPPAHCPNARFFEEFGVRVQANKAAGARQPRQSKSALDFTHASRS